METIKKVIKLVFELMSKIKYEFGGVEVNLFQVFIFVTVVFLIIWFLKSLID